MNGRTSYFLTCLLTLLFFFLSKVVRRVSIEEHCFLFLAKMLLSNVILSVLPLQNDLQCPTCYIIAGR